MKLALAASLSLSLLSLSCGKDEVPSKDVEPPQDVQEVSDVGVDTPEQDLGPETETQDDITPVDATEDVQPVDTGTADTGTPDTGTVDTGTADVVTIPLELALACDASPQAVHGVSIADVDPQAPLGQVLACTQDAPATALEVADEAAKNGIVTSAGIRRYRIAYLTQRSEGVPGVGTARVMLPDPPPAGPLNVIAVAHGTTGLADHCAPSKYPDVLTEMALPFAGNDSVVVMPDYAGLGNEGTQGYGESHDTAHSVLDAVRAVHALFTPGSLTENWGVLGHSQGGGAVLYVQGLAGSYLQANDPILKAVVAFSPGWTSSPEPDPALYAAPWFFSVTMGQGVSAAALVLSLYADAVNHVDPEEPGLYFHVTASEELVGWIKLKCVGSIALQFLKKGDEVTLKDILDPVFLGVSLSCLQGDPACTEPYAGFIERQKANYIPPDPQGAPIFYVQGMDDKQATPKRAACNLEAMAAAGVTPETCIDLEANHFDVVGNNLATARDWIRAQLDGTEPPACEWDASILPTCQ